MLVLSRQVDESIMVGDDVEVTIVDIRGDKVRLGIKAPKHLAVHRKEVFLTIKRENRAAGRVARELGGISSDIDQLLGPKAADETHVTPPQRDQAHGLRALAIGDEAAQRAAEAQREAASPLIPREQIGAVEAIAARAEGQAQSDQHEEARAAISSPAVSAHRPHAGPRPLRGNAAGPVPESGYGRA